ncbi:MAG TPA: hypothetical protein VIM09_05950 [Chthoniobacterales bacterium]
MREVSSTVLFVDGQPSVDRGSREKPIPLTADFHPGRGDVLETPGASRVGLSLLPNLLVLLDRGARMEIIRLALTKDGNETGLDMRGRSAEIKLSQGRILVSHAWGEAQARFSLATSGGEVTTPSNALVVVQSEQQKTRVTCASGWVEFRPSGAANAIRVPPGSVGEWPSAGANITAAEADPVAQEDLQQAIEVEQMLRGLAAPKRNALPR